MNNKNYRLVFSRLRGMLVAVGETAAASGKQAGQITVSGSKSHGVIFSLRQIAFAALALLGALPSLSGAQIVPGGAHAPSVVQTQNGLDQVNINRPSGAGVSMNTYGRFDVPSKGAILNNSPTIVQTQQAGTINGNPNFAAGQSAKIIVNQVNSASASQLNGFLETAGNRAEVIIANPSGISVNGGGFINTSRAILTTGTPNYAADGSVSGFNITGGNITVSGAGLNASNVDQVDFLARAVQANAAIYAKNLNVVTGANSVDHDTLSATPIAGDGPAPGVSIDVSNLGGMYANRIVLVGTEAGVGVSLKGVVAANAGDLVLTTQGKLKLASQASASGNINISAHDGIDNSGTTYAQQNVSLSTSGTLTNSGMIAAQQNTTVSAGEVNSTGTLASGVNGDGSLAQSGDLNVSASGAVTATARNVAGGNAAVSGAALNLAGSTTSANGAITLAASSGDLNVSGATTSAGGTLDARASGTLTNDNGAMSSGGAQTIMAGALSNRGGQMVSGGALTENVSGATNNAGGTMQANGAISAASGSLDNSGGHIASLDADGVNIATSGLLNNGAGGSIGGNGNVTLQAGQIDNAGSITAVQSLIASAVETLFNSGTFAINANMTLSTGSTLTNAGQLGAAGAFVLSARTFDNSGGTASANQFTLNAANLVNHAGTITQYGLTSMGFNVSGTFDNSNGGTFQTNSTDLTLAPGSLVNDGGTILDAGTGTLTIAPGNGVGSVSNVGGRIITAGQLAAQAGSLNNANGVLAAQGNLAANIAGNVDNTQGAVRSLSSLSLASGGTLTNTNGQIQSGTGAAGDASTLAVRAASVGNTNGLVGNLGMGNTTVHGGSQTVNTGGVMTGNGDVAVDTSALVNTKNGQLGGQISGVNVSVQADTVDNSAGQIGNLTGSNGNVAITTTGAVTNTNGQIGATHNLSVNAAALTGGGAYTAASDVAVAVQGDFAPTPDLQFAAGHDLTFTLPGTFSNGATLVAANNLGINAGDITNSGVLMAGSTLTTHSNTLENTGAIVGGSVSLNANSTISNVGPTALIGATDSNGKLELLAQDIENRDDTTMTDTQATTAIYGLGKVVLAGGRNADGSYSNANLIRNQSGLIESAGDMELHAGQVTNTRTTMTTTGLNQPVDPALLDQLGISLSGCTAVNVAACSGQDVGWSSADPSMIGGVNIEPPHGGQWNSGYQYTTYTGVAVANLIATISPQAQIVAGGNLDTSTVGLFQNYWSAVAAVGNIAAPVTLDQNSWQGQGAPAVQVTYAGYYHYNNYDNSEHNWTLPFGNAPFVGSNPGGYQAAPADIRYYALPSYESSFVAGGTLSGTGVNIDNRAGNAGIPSMGLAPGQAMSGVKVSTVNGGADMIDPVIAGATAVNVLSNLTVPQGGLFKPVTSPGAGYLIETNPAFTNQKTFISSDYYLQQLGLNPQTTEKRLGDGFYEQQLVRNQITSLTGKAVLGPYTDLQSMYESLLAAGASLSQSLDLPLGMSLSPEQVAALTSNVIIMQTEVVDGQSVLVPVVYLAKASQQNMNGPLIAATDIDIQNAQTFTSSGTVQAGNTLSIQGNQISNAFGALQSGGLMSLTTKGNVDLTSATVNAGSLALNAGGDLLLNTAVKTVDQISATGATRTATTLGPIANLNVAGNAVIVTGGNVEQNAGNLNVDGNLGMAVVGNYNIGAVQTGEHKVVAGANGVSNTNVNQTTGSTVNVGGVSQIGVGGDLTATGANINLGGGVVAANGNVTLQAAKATSTTDSNSSGSDSHGSYSESLHRSDDTLTATTLNAGNSLTVASGKDINITGSAISLDRGTATLAATGSVNIGAATETHVDNSQEQHKHSNVVSGKEVRSSSNSTATVSQGSLVSADAVQIASGKDINVAGSTIVGTNDVALSAAHDVNITTTQNTAQSSSAYEEKRTGLGTSGLTVTVGTNNLATTNEASSVTNNASTVGSINGDLSIQAGNTLHVTGSDLVAGGNLAGTAANVIIDAATDISHQAQTQKTSSSGLTIGLAGSVGDAINNAYSESQAASHSASSGNDRAAALHSIAAAGDVGLVGMGAKTLADGGKPDIGIKASIGSSRSQSQSSEDEATQRGTSVQAGGAAAFVATNGDVTIAGSNVSANDVVLAAKNQVNVINTTDTDSTRSSNSSSSASIGVQYTAGGGFGVSAAMANAHGDANSDASIQNASHVTGANSVTVISGGDTNIIGSQIAGKQVTADVGGNLNIASVQDVTNSAAHQSSAGGGFTISQGGGSASFSAQNGHADSNYAGVNEQAGIMAGDGGFNVNVKGNTGLTGAVISSTADASKNSLTTGTLTYSDIQNQSHYDASSNGISAGVGFGGSTGKSVGPGSVSGHPGVSPMISQNDSGDQSATARSAISAGTITITDDAHQTQNLASLSRDTTDANGTVAKTPDVNDILNRQADTMQAAQAAGQTVSQGIGAYADMKRDDAVTALQAAKDRGDTAGMAAALADYNNWREGGDSRAEFHAAGGALIGGLGGGTAFSTIGGAAGAGMSSLLAPQTKELSDAVAGATGSSLIGNLAGNIASGMGGAIIGGSAGAAGASNVNLYNQGNNKDEDKARHLVEQAIGVPPGTTQGQSIGALIDQFIGMVKGGAAAKMAESPSDLAAQGVANGLNAVVGTGGGKPPTASPGVVLADSTAANAIPGTAGYVPSNATLNSRNSDGAKGNVNVEPGATPDSNEVRAGQGLANAGYDVAHQPTANSQGIPDVRTADLSINGVGQVDVYTPKNTSPNGIVRNIEGKFDQANGVVVQADLSEADMNSIAARTWGKPNGNNFNTIFFQNSSGQVFRFDRPTLGK
ncbi:hemagglutinin repeat-containing protein [Paraburkholderia sp. IW21]|uniref:two-partner secretion domain-containing protein n=1 Tax=Paraburkholderia sp. IW21 TaxID=3242488 RepID=UPI0035203602